MKYISQISQLTRLVSTCDPRLQTNFIEIVQTVRTLALAVHADFLPEATDIHQLIVSALPMPVLLTDLLGRNY
jgi:hypothetical protein